MSKSTWRSVFEHSLTLLVLTILVLYTYARFFEVPYVGFDYQTSSGRIIDFSQDAPEDSLQLGDVLLQVGSLSWDEYRTTLHRTLFEKGQDEIPLLVQRGDEQVEILWKVPETDIRDVQGRFMMLWIPYIFWLAGAATQLLVRPKDSRWWLLIAFNYLTAIWLIAGLDSRWHVWGSALVLRAVVWLCLPVYWHLHWIFPRPLGRTPAWLLSLYPISIVAAVLEITQILPGIYPIGFLLALLGSLVLLILHAVKRPEQRRDLARMAVFVGAAILPLAVFGIILLLGTFVLVAPVTLLALPAIPGGYLYVAYRRQPGAPEMRANRLAVGFLYSIFLVTLVAITWPIINQWLANPEIGLFVDLGLLILVGLGSVWFYPRFARWAEQSLLHIPIPPAQLLETYTERVVTSLDPQRLVTLWRGEVLPSLFIRQAAFLRLGDNLRPTVLFIDGNGVTLPTDDEIPALLADAGRVRPPENPILPWARLVLPLRVGEKVVGLCLLGRRDPDDEYRLPELPLLRSLIDHTALALVNIEQAERLRSLYQANIERQEAERSSLSRDLHDAVLGKLADLYGSVADTSKQLPSQFEATYQYTVDYIRNLISGLRPVMLNYGLGAALNELVDEISVQVGGNLAIHLEIPASEIRYPPEVELHLYRIVQQACQNALKHAQARNLRIGGRLEAGIAHISITDDGIGFAAGENLDLDGFLAKRHFGLAGMHERAALVGAKMSIESSPEQGTRVTVTWRQPTVTSG